MATVRTACSFTPSASSSRTLLKAHCNNNDSFPAGLRVLVVDDDPICLLILDRMLQRCQYTVTTCGRAADALAMLRENRDSFDVIISDVYMPDMDGFKLLELVGLEMDLPVIMMSVNGETSAVMKGIKHGACDYLLKPVRMEELRNIWQHVVRKKWRSSTHLVAADKEKGRHASDDSDHHSSANEGDHGTWEHGKKRSKFKEDEGDDDLDPEDPSTTKKPRVVWSVELHQQFVNAVNQLGIDKAVPKRILELMNVHGLTRENVASHLQKYRLYLKRISGIAFQSGSLSPSFSVFHDASFGPVSSAGHRGVGDFRAIGGSNELRSQMLLAGVLGKLNQANNLKIHNAEESNLLQLTAVRGVDSGSFNQAPITASYGQQALSESAGLQSEQCDAKPVQLAQMGESSDLAFEKLPLGLSTHQQQQLKSAVGIRELGQLSGPGNFHQLNSNTGALIMQSLQRQQGADMSLNKSGLMISPCGGQQGISTDARIWATSISNFDGNMGLLHPLLGQCGLPLRVNSTPRACPGSSTQGPLAEAPDQDRECKGQQGFSTDAGVWRSVMSNLNGGGSAGNVPTSQDTPLLEIRFSESGVGSFERAYDVESKRSLSAKHGNVSPMDTLSVSSSMAASEPDHSLYHQMKDVNSSSATSNSMTAQNLVHGFPGIPGMEQEPRASQGAEGSWPGFSLGQDFVQVCKRTIQSPSYSSGGSSTTQGFPVLSDQGQSDLRGQVFPSGFTSSFSADFNPENKRQTERITSENISKARVEGHAWISEPLSDDLLSFVLQQQQEGLGLTE